MQLTRATALTLWALVTILSALIIAAAWPWIAPRTLHREVSFSLTIHGQGPAAVWWTNPTRVNGFWIDPDDPIIKSTVPQPGARTISIRHNLPSDAIDTLECRATPGARVTSTDAEVRTYFRARLVSTQHLTATADGDEVLFRPALPAIDADYPQGRWYASLAGAVVGFTACLIFAVTRRIEHFRAERVVSAPRPIHRWHTPTTITLCFTIPLLMALWAPMFIIADSTAYIWIAHLLRQSGNLEHFDGWRLPGYALILLPFISLFKDFAIPVGLFQALLGSLTALLVLNILRPRLRAPWPHATALLVAIDPILLAWQRVVMCETASAFFITLAAWLFLKAADKPDERPRRAFMMGAGIGAALGLACGAACLIRGNNLVLPAVILAALLFIALLHHNRRALAAILPAAAFTFLCLLPLCILNLKHFDRFSMAVGRDFTRSLFSWENGTTDWNQCGTLSFDEFKDLRTKLRNHSLTDWQVMEWLEKNTATIPAPSGTRSELIREIRCKAFVDEALSRNGPGFFKAQYNSAAGLLGFPVTHPDYALPGTWAVFAQLRGQPNPRTPTNFDFSLSFFPPDLQEVIKPAIHDVSWTQQSLPAKVFGHWFDAWRWVRAGLGVLYILALVRLLCTGRWAFAAVGVVALANIVGVPVMTYAAEYRYAAPFYPVVAITLFYGLFTPALAAKKQDQSRP